MSTFNQGIERPLSSVGWQRGEAGGEAAPHEAGPRYRTLFEQMPLGIFLFDHRLRLTDCNQYLLNVLRLTRERAVGFDLRQLRDHHIIPKLYGALQGHITLYEGPYRATLSDVQVEIRMKVSPLHDAKGRSVGGIALVEDLTAQKQLEQARWTDEERYRLMVEGSEQVFFYLHTPDHRFDYLSPSVEQVLGYSPDELLGRPYDVLLVDDPVNEGVRARTAAALQTGQRQEPYEALIRHKSGRPIWLELVESPLIQQERVVGVQGFARDITARKREERLRAAMYEMAEAIHETSSLSHLFQAIHHALGRLIPTDNFYVALRVEGEPDTFSFPYEVDARDQFGDQPHHIPDSMTAFVARTGQPLLLDRTRYEAMIEAGELRELGSPPACWLGVPLKLQDEVLGVVAVQSYTDPERYSERDIEVMAFVSTQIATAIVRKQAEQALRESKRSLEYMAHHDALTRLPNRLLCFQRLDQALTTTDWRSSFLALLYLDLDHFKDVNDSLGHDAGDRLLQAVADRLSHCVRADDTVARMGGDEFVIVLPDLAAPYEASRIARRILAELAHPFHVEGQTVTIAVSIGISLATGPDANAENLLRQADHAMYRAKQDGENHYHWADAARPILMPDPDSP